MSFAEIAKLDPKEQEKIIELIEWAKNRLKLTTYLIQAANQEADIVALRKQVAIKWNKEKLNTQQVAIEWNKEKLNTQQVAIAELAENAKILESNIRIALQWGIKLPIDYKKTMSTVISFWKPPETVKYFQEVLANPNNFSH